MTQHLMSSRQCAAAEAAAQAPQAQMAPPPPPDATMQQHNRSETVDHLFPAYAFQDESVFPDPESMDQDTDDSIADNGQPTVPESDSSDEDIRDLLDRHDQYIADGFADMPIPIEMRVKIDLINILREGCAPLNLIKKIWEWAGDAVLKDIDFSNSSCTRASVIKFLK